MSVKMFNNLDTFGMVAGYEKHGLTVEHMASRYGCSVSTIRRVLAEHSQKYSEGMRKRKEPPINIEETKKIMSLLYRYGIGYDHLEVILNAPALTANNVVDFLKKANPAQLAIILHHSGLAETLPIMPTKPIPKDAQQPLFPEPE